MKRIEEIESKRMVQTFMLNSSKQTTSTESLPNKNQHLELIASLPTGKVHKLHIIFQSTLLGPVST